MDSRGASINEIVNLLDTHGGEILTLLKERCPSRRDQLTAGLTLGANDISAKLDAEVCFAGLQTAIRICHRATEGLRRRLKVARSCALAGQILTATAGASIFGVIAANAPKITEYIVGTLALIGALVTIISEFVSKIGGAGNVEDNFAKLNTAAYDCALLEANLAGKLRQKRKSDAIWKDVNMLVGKGNELSREVVRIASPLGVGTLTPAESNEVFALLDLNLEQYRPDQRRDESPKQSFQRLAVTGHE